MTALCHRRIGNPIPYDLGRVLTILYNTGVKSPAICDFLIQLHLLLPS